MTRHRLLRLVRGHACILVLAVVACVGRRGSKSPTIPAPVPPSPAAEPEAPAPVLTAEEVQERDIAELVDAFCFDRALATTMPAHVSHEYFTPPDGTPHPHPDEWDLGQEVQLASCDEIEHDVLGTWTAGDTRAILVELRAVVEDEEGYGPGLVATEQYLVIHAGPTRHIHRLGSRTPPWSEEAPDVDCELDEVQLRDVGLGPQPEWIAVRTHDVGDCYECDFCWEQQHTYRRLVICTHDAPRPRCIEIPLEEEEVLTARFFDEDENDDCDDGNDADERLEEAAYDLAQELLDPDWKEYQLVSRAQRSMGITEDQTQAEFIEAVVEHCSDSDSITTGFLHTYSMPAYGILRVEDEDGPLPSSISELLDPGDHDLRRLFETPELGPEVDDRSLHGH